MAKSKKPEKKGKAKVEEESELNESSSNPVAAKIIGAIILLLLCALFILGFVGKAGTVGDWTIEHAFTLFGYFIYGIPLICAYMGVWLLWYLGDPLDWRPPVGALLFSVGSITSMHVISPNHTLAGIIGNFFGNPMIHALDQFLGIVISIGITLFGLWLIPHGKPVTHSVLGIFGTIGTHIHNWFATLTTKNESLSEFDNNIETMNSDEFEDTDQDETEEEAETHKHAQAPAQITTQNKQHPAQETEQQSKKPSKDSPPFKIYSRVEYKAPSTALLNSSIGKPVVGDPKEVGLKIKHTLANFGINVEMDEISIGPAVTRFAMRPAQGTRLQRIAQLDKELSYTLAAYPIRIEAPIPGKSLVGIEVPNKSTTPIGLGSLLSDPAFKDSPDPLTVALGKNVSGKSYYTNIAKMPHLLVAGATGSGKSVTVHNLIISMLYKNSPDDLKLIMVDPKRVELTLYNDVPHLLTPVIKEARKTIIALKWATKEMDRRYNVLEQNKVRDIQSYHQNVVAPAHKESKDKDMDYEDPLPERMPYIVIIIDELADIMQAYPRELEQCIVRLAQMSRAVGIHLILSTQRPSTDVITGLIKANIPSRIALKVASQIDSRTILDGAGAETLLGRGDMLFSGAEMGKAERIQCAFVTENEVKNVVSHIIKDNREFPPDIIDLTGDTGVEGSIVSESFEDGGNDSDDTLYNEAKILVIKSKIASTSYIQRKLKVGYSRAARLMDLLETNGVISAPNGSKPREVLMKDSQQDDYENSDSEDSDTEYDRE